MQNELGDFLRARRAQLTPKQVGLPAGPRRRTAGLRREEVAALAGIGVDWYVRIEQGRCVAPSSATLDALARALKLTGVEHAHLRALTRAPARPAFVRETVPEALRQILHGLRDPAYVTGERWDVLAWNRAAESLLHFGKLPEADRNILIHLLTTPPARRMFGASWAEQARRVVAQFRTSHDLWAGDPAFADLLARVRAGCPEFSAWWKSHEVRDSPTGIKKLRHPTRGLQKFVHASFQSNDDPRLRLVIYTRVA